MWFSNPTVDAQATRALGMTNSAARLAADNRMEQMLMEGVVGRSLSHSCPGSQGSQPAPGLLAQCGAGDGSSACNIILPATDEALWAPLYHQDKRAEGLG